MPVCREYSAGRRWLDRLPHGCDLIPTLEGLCDRHHIQAAVFSLIGAVSKATLGTYDQRQQVYVTFQREGHLEILSCLGNVSLKDGKPFVHAHVVLAAEGGQTVGGHLFSETILFAGEVHLLELTGPSLMRKYDQTTGLMLWETDAFGG